MNTGIYTITSIIDNKVYVGHAKNIKLRWNGHISRLRNNRHENKHLQSAFNLYKENNFKFEILWECEEKYLYSEEHYWCNLLNVNNPKFGYNIAQTNPNGTWGFSEETRKKMSESRKNTTMSEISKKKLSITMSRKRANGEIKLSEQGRENLRLAQKNRVKKILNIKTGEIFNSGKELAECLNVPYQTINSRMHRKSKIFQNYKYVEK